MSTTVSYKGQTLTTVSNDTKTLLTEGKYLEDDLTLVDVSGGGAVLTTKNISANGTYNASSDSADGYSQVTVAVPASAVDTGTKSITANGNGQDVVGYAAVNVNVPNSYSAADEGKVVSSGALVAQTAHADVTPTTSDQTIDTTTNNSVKVKGDADLIAANIKKDVEIFGVTGSYEGGGGGNDNFEDLVNGSLSGAVTITTATAIKDSVFLGSTLMTSISSNTVTRIDNAAFYNCTRLQSASFPNVTSFGGSQNFHGCSLLSSIYFPKLSADIPNYAFRNCSALVNVALQKAVSFNTGVFQGCTALQSFDVGGNGGYFGANTFNSTALNTLVIRSTSVKTLGNTNAFASTPFASGGTGGTLYVPSALVSSYQSASNWSTILGYANNSIQAIEGSYYETHYADGTVIS